MAEVLSHNRVAERRVREFMSHTLQGPIQHRSLIRTALDDCDRGQSLKEKVAFFSKVKTPSNQEKRIRCSTTGDAIDGMLINLIRVD